MVNVSRHGGTKNKYVRAFNHLTTQLFNHLTRSEYSVFFNILFYTLKEEGMEFLKWRELFRRTSEGRSRYCGEGVSVAGLYACYIQKADSVCID